MAHSIEERKTITCYINTIILIINIVSLSLYTINIGSLLLAKGTSGASLWFRMSSYCGSIGYRFGFAMCHKYYSASASVFFYCGGRDLNMKHVAV